jgi:hypothetical protein
MLPEPALGLGSNVAFGQATGSVDTASRRTLDVRARLVALVLISRRQAARLCAGTADFAFARVVRVEDGLLVVVG